MSTRNTRLAILLPDLMSWNRADVGAIASDPRMLRKEVVDAFRQRRPFSVIGPDYKLYGHIASPQALAKLLAGDPPRIGSRGASVKVDGRAGRPRRYVYLTDVDAWLLLDRKFKLADYKTRSHTILQKFESGAQCYSLRFARV